MEEYEQEGEEKVEEEQLTDKTKSRSIQQLAIARQKWEEQVAMESRWGHRKGTEKASQETQETQTNLTNAKWLRLFISEQSDGLVIGNPTMFLLGVFALTVGVAGVASQFLKEDAATRRIDLTAYGVPVPSYEEVAAVVHGGVDRDGHQYR